MKIIYRPGNKNAMADFLSRGSEESEFINNFITALRDNRKPLHFSFALTLKVNMELEQSKDVFYGKMLKILKATGSDSKYRLISRNYCLKNNLLYRISCRDGVKTLLLVIPRSQRQRILQYAHDECAHQGITRTYERIHIKYYWPGMMSDTARFCVSCTTCQMKRGPNRAPGWFLQSIRCKGPFDTVGRDYVGPFQTSKRRNKYPLVAVDQ